MRLTESLLSARTKTIQTAQQLEKLWIHEVIRTFCDRFESDEDKKKFDEILSVNLKKLGSYQALAKSQTIVFGGFKYDEDGEKFYTEYPNISSFTDRTAMSDL